MLILILLVVLFQVVMVQAKTIEKVDNSTIQVGDTVYRNIDIVKATNERDRLIQDRDNVRQRNEAQIAYLQEQIDSMDIAIDIANKVLDGKDTSKVNWSYLDVLR